ncbi:MAG: extracellular solute-binding protein [Treponema sp.]|nr:extracellular solute-binding protein [Treponema sp.]
MKLSRIFYLLAVMLVTGSLLYAGGARSGGTQSASGRQKLRVEIYDRGTAGLNLTNNLKTRFVQEKFGDPRNVDIEFVPVPRAQEIDMLNILMAANNAPDICFTYNTATVTNYVQEGGLLDLGPYLQTESGKKLTAYMTPAVLEYGVWNGIQYAIPAKRIEAAAICTYIRKDWLDKLGLKPPATFDEFYQTLIAFKTRDPGGLGNAVIPMALDGYEGKIYSMAQIILDAYTDPLTPEQLACYPYFYRPGIKEGMRYMNKLYNEGLISPNFALDKDYSQLIRDVTSGKVGAFIREPMGWPYGNNGNELENSVPGAVFIPIDPFPNKQGVRVKFGYDPIGMYNIIPKTSKAPHLAIDYLSWMSESDVLFFLQNGQQGIHYERLQDGIPTGVKTTSDLPNEHKVSGDMAIIVNGSDYGSEELNNKAILLSDPKFGQYRIDAAKIARTGMYLTPSIKTPIRSESELGATVRDKGNELYVRSIMCPPAQFDQIFDSFLKEYMDIGGKRIMDEKLAAWAKEHP